MHSLSRIFWRQWSRYIGVDFSGVYTQSRCAVRAHWDDAWLDAAMRCRSCWRLWPCDFGAWSGVDYGRITHTFFFTIQYKLVSYQNKSGRVDRWRLRDLFFPFLGAVSRLCLENIHTFCFVLENSALFSRCYLALPHHYSVLCPGAWKCCLLGGVHKHKGVCTPYVLDIFNLTSTPPLLCSSDKCVYAPSQTPTAVPVYGGASVVPFSAEAECTV